MMKTLFINQLEESTQKAIERELTEMGFSQEDIENALDSRLCDLSDTININAYLNA